jgi:hypothetical protein
VDNAYPYRNQVINALTFLMKTSAEKNVKSLLGLFEIDIDD